MPIRRLSPMALTTASLSQQAQPGLFPYYSTAGPACADRGRRWRRSEAKKESAYTSERGQLQGEIDHALQICILGFFP